MSGYEFRGVSALTAIQTEFLYDEYSFSLAMFDTLNMVEINKKQILNLFVMTGLPHDKICTDHFHIIDNLLTFPGFRNLLQ